AGRTEIERGVPHEFRSLQLERAGGLPRLAHRRPPRSAETADPQSIRSVQHDVHHGQARERARHHHSAMTTYAISLLDRLPTPIAVVTESGAVEYRNKRFEETFGGDTMSWRKEGARAVAGERGWLQGFFLAAEDGQTLDGEIARRVYRIDTINSIDGC